MIKVYKEGLHVRTDGTIDMVSDGLSASPELNIKLGDEERTIRGNGITLSDVPDNGIVTKAKGSTVKWNQIFNYGVPSYITNGSSYNIVDNTYNITHGNLEVNAVDVKLNLVVGRVYCFMATAKTEHDDTWIHLYYGNASNKLQVPNDNTWHRLSTIVTCVSDTYRMIRFISSSSGDSQYKDILLIDLTAIFGAGNEPASVADFESWLSTNVGLKDYYDYDAGSLITVKTSKITTTDGSKVTEAKMNVTTLQGKLNGIGNPVTIFPDGLKQAGSIKDEIDWANGVAVKRVYRLIAKDATWTLQSINNYGVANFRTQTNSAAAPKDNTMNAIASKYNVQSTNIAETQTEGVKIAAGNSIYIRILSSRASNTTELQTLLNAEDPVIYYELNTPETYYFDTHVDIKRRYIGVDILNGASSIQGSVSINGGRLIPNNNYNWVKDKDGHIIFPDGMKKAGSVYDEITMVNGVLKAIKRVGCVDLGNVDYISDVSVSNLFRVALDTPKVPNTNKYANLKTAIYPTIKQSDESSVNYDCISGLNWWDGIAFWVNSGTSYTANELKTAMQGVLLYYELATPIEYVIDNIREVVKVVDTYDKLSGYTRLEYLESSGAQYIDTGVNRGDNSVEIKCRPLNNLASTYGFVFGCRRNPDDNTFAVPIKRGSDAYFIQYGTIVNTVKGDYYNTDVILSNRKNVFTVNGVSTTLNSYTFTNDYNFYLFSINENGMPIIRETNKSRVYYLKIFNDSSVLIQHLVPCRRNSDNVLGMYDTVSGNFLTNQGTGSFIAGPVAEDGVQYAGEHVVYRNQDYYGVRWTYSNGENSTTLERIGRAEWHNSLPIQSKMRRCILGSDGSVRYVHPDNYLIDTEGNAIDYTVTEANGVKYDVMVEVPEHYYETGSETVDGVTYRYIKLYPYAKVGRKVPKHYIGAFKASLNRTTNELFSCCKTVFGSDYYDVDGSTLSYADDAVTYRGGGNDDSYDGTGKTLYGRPASNKSITDFCTYAKNRGNGYALKHWESHWCMWRLFVVEYATFNSQDVFNAMLDADGNHQGGLGFGLCSTTDAWSSYNNYNPIAPCGITLRLGSSTGIVKYIPAVQYGSDSYFNVPSYRGIENPFGDIWEITNGIYIVGADSKNYIMTADDGWHVRDFSYDSSTTPITGFTSRTADKNLGIIQGWPTDFIWDSHGDIIPTVINTTAANTVDTTSPFRDYFWGAKSDAKRVILGGGLGDDVRAGFACLGGGDAVSHVRRNRGSRLLYIAE